jgi:hypothetical protein
MAASLRTARVWTVNLVVLAVCYLWVHADFLG